LKILHIDTERTWRGGEQQVLYLLRGLRERGHDSTVICQPASPLAERAGAEGIHVKEVAMKGGLDPFAVFEISRAYRQGYQICHMHTSNAHSLGYYASLLAKGPKLAVSRRVSFPLKGFLGKLKYTGADRIIAVSAEIKKGLVKKGIDEEKVAVVHSAIDLKRFDKYEGEPEKPVVGIFAHLAEHKGHKYFFDAGLKISKDFPHVSFIVAGDGEERGNLEKYVESLGIEGKVDFRGFSKEVPSLLKECTITVLSSISGEGSPGVLKESMAAGVPVITTDVGGSAEVVENGRSGIVVPPADSEALAKGMEKLLGHKSFREAMRRGGLERVKAFSAENMVDKTEALYREILRIK